MIRTSYCRRILLPGIALAFLLSGLQGMAQERRRSTATSGSSVFVTSGSGAQGTYRFVNSQAPFNLKTVKGAPYSAEAVTTTTQNLPDGNRIFRESSTLVARDSEGRTRQELTLPTVGAWVPENDGQRQVLINDPIQGVSLTLDPSQRTAHRMALPIVVTAKQIDKDQNIVVTSDDQVSWHKTEDGEKGGIYVVRRTPEGVKVENANGEEIKTAKLRIRSSNGNRFAFRTPGKSGEKGEGQATVEFFSTASGAGPHVLHFDHSDELGESRSEDLGTKNMQGVLVEGTRTVRTIEAGVLGNERPIEIVSERWYSPDLQTVIMSRHYDPRSGETIFQLKNLTRDEPDPALFEVPEDYTIQKGNSFGFVQRQP